MHNQGLDNKLYCVLPEGVSINLVPAGVVVRSYAYLTDLFIRILIFLSFSVVLNQLAEVGVGLFLLLYFVLSWGYYILLEARTGRTPGKKRYNLRVIQDNGLPARLNQIIIRNLLRPADIFPFAYLLGIMVMTGNNAFKRIGDWAAGTIVAYDDQARELPDQTGDSVAAPDFELSGEEQQAIVEYAERARDLSEPRQAELANILSGPLGVRDKAAAERLKAIASYYLGQVV